MARFKAKKVATPGSRPEKMSAAKGKGRPKSKKKKKEQRGTRRVDNYRHKWKEAAMQQALRDIKENKMSVRDAAKVNIPVTYRYLYRTTCFSMLLPEKFSFGAQKLHFKIIFCNFLFFSFPGERSS